MALPVWQRTIVTEAGDVVSGAEIEVILEATGTAATIYSDRAGTTPESNPFFTGSDGFAKFYAAAGAYRITATGPSGSITWRYEVLIDPTTDTDFTGALSVSGEVTGDGARQLLAYQPGHYARDVRWRIKDNTLNRNVIVSPNALGVNIDGMGYIISTAVEIDINTAANWDTTTPTDYTTAANRAGVDFYIYACAPSSGKAPDFVLSANSTYPSGYTADNSRKVAGFHGLTADAGTLYGYVNSVDDVTIAGEAFVSHNITGTKHWLDGYVQGDPLPFSLWDLEHRPRCKVEGMVYDPGSDLWVDIYLASWDGTRLVSADGGTIADGASTPKFHKAKFGQHFARQKKRLPVHDEFQSLSLGSPQGVNITGSADPVTTGGGHTATNGQRILSLIGCEDATGVLWQWGNGQASASRSSYANGYTADDANVAGQDYSDPNRPIFGGDWSGGAKCGSRGSTWTHPALYLASNRGARGVAKPYGGRA